MSKAFAEELVYAYKDMVPVVVIRPSIVVSAHKEPVAGYVDGLQVRQINNQSKAFNEQHFRAQLVCTQPSQPEFSDAF